MSEAVDSTVLEVFFVVHNVTIKWNINSTNIQKGDKGAYKNKMCLPPGNISLQCRRLVREGKLAL